MPFNHLPGEETGPEVLSRVEGFAGIRRWRKSLFRWTRCESCTGGCSKSPEGFGLEKLLTEMRVDLRVDAGDAARIPASGPVVVVANHPFGMLDGAVLAVLLTRSRPDVKVMTNYLLRDVPELAQHCIFVNPFQNDPLLTDRAASARSIDINRRAMREALSLAAEGWNAGHLSRGRSLDVAISSCANRRPGVERYGRSPDSTDGAAALPIYFCGRNSMSFHLFGMIHPRLRTAFLLQEFLQQEGRTVEVRVGSEIPGDSVSGHG